MATTDIRIRGAREHNLRDVSLDLPRGSLICFTGVSGSGKSSLVQAILLAQEAATRRGDTVRLNGPFGLELGTAEDVLNWARMW